MKTIYSCLLLSIFFSSCTLDESTPPVQNNPLKMDIGIGRSTERIGDVLPANSDNPCDTAGKLHDEILMAYFAGENLPTNLWAIADRIKTVAYSLPDYVAITTPLTTDPDLNKVQHILSNPNTCVVDIVSGTGMSPSGKASLHSFITASLILMQDNIDYAVLHDFVCKYETGVLSDIALNEKDKKIILTTSSITRYSVYRQKKRPKKNTDPDWNLMIANIIGGTYGADSDMAEAITTALIAGIAQNH